jgi:hypothetical protein
MPTEKPTVHLKQAANGQITAVVKRPDGREYLLHSGVNPAVEADFLLEETPLLAATLYVVLGAGFGYHIRQLLTKLSRDCLVIVVESVALPLGNSMAAYQADRGETWVKDKRLIFGAFHDPTTICFSLAHQFIQHNLRNVEVITHIPSTLSDPGFYQKAAQHITQDFSGVLRNRILQCDRMLDNHLLNYWDNLATTWNGPSVAPLAGLCKNMPAIIISAGPSLDSQLEMLAQLQGKALLICVGTAANILRQHHIIPDFIITVDPYAPNATHFASLEPSPAALVYYQHVCRSIAAAYVGPKFWFTLKNEPAIPLDHSLRNSPFIGGGTVAFSALQLAYFVQADPLIFVGQDFSFLAGKTHADGAVGNLAFSETALPENFFPITSTSGKIVITNNEYYTYLLFMQEFIQQHPTTRHINTSPTGADIAGTQWLSLAEVVETICTRSVNFQERIRQSWLSFQPSSSRERLALLNVWEAELSHFLKHFASLDQPAKVLGKFSRLAVFRLNESIYREIFNGHTAKEIYFGEPSSILPQLKAHAAQLLDLIHLLQQKYYSKAGDRHE